MHNRSNYYLHYVLSKAPIFFLLLVLVQCVLFSKYLWSISIINRERGMEFVLNILIFQPKFIDEDNLWQSFVFFYSKQKSEICYFLDNLTFPVETMNTLLIFAYKLCNLMTFRICVHFVKTVHS